MRNSPAVGILLKTNSLIDLDRKLKLFLAKSSLVDARGNVYSWLNPRHPGFVYPEIMGLYLNLSSQLIRAPNTPKASKTVNALLENRSHAVAKQLQKLISPVGGLGKQGQIYAFDNCMAIAGLLAYKQHLGGFIEPKILLAMTDFAVKLLRQKLVCTDDLGNTVEQKLHWSNTFGASTLKNAIALNKLAQETQDITYRQLALQIAEDAIDRCFRGSYFTAFATTNTVYCHAHCYALEGLLYLQTQGYRQFDRVLKAGVKQLKAWQNDDGSMYNWYNNAFGQRFKVADATAQAIRLWLAIDRDFYAENIERGWQFLISLQSPQTGLYYQPDSQDRNSWASIFTVQAMDWYFNGADGSLLV